MTALHQAQARIIVFRTGFLHKKEPAVPPFFQIRSKRSSRTCDLAHPTHSGHTAVYWILWDRIARSEYPPELSPFHSRGIASSDLLPRQSTHPVYHWVKSVIVRSAIHQQNVEMETVRFALLFDARVKVFERFHRVRSMYG